MAPCVACYDWNKGSALVCGGHLVAVGPALRWNRSGVLRGHVKDQMRAAGQALKARVVAATGVGLSSAAGDEWLAAKLADLALVKRVLLAQTAEEYLGLVRLMKADDCVWVQVGEDDWSADHDVTANRTWGEALWLTHSPAGSVMSDVEKAPPRVVGVQRDDGINARLHRLRDGTTVRRMVDVLPARVLLRGQRRQDGTTCKRC